MGKLIYENESYHIRGAIFEVYREMGPGWLEPVYQECLEIELEERDIPFTAQAALALSYKGRPLSKSYTPDFLCHQKIVIEIKAVEKLTDKHRAQLFNYLKATRYRLGFLVNFGAHPEVDIERIVFGDETPV